jgi:Tfp pilus assembly protein PilN
MRPVNLIPPHDRHGTQKPLRTGPLPYLLIGALVAAVAGVAALVLTGNEIAERKEEVVTVKREDAAAQVRAQKLAAYIQFAEMRERRVATITSLADSRFDWERVMRELSKVLPADVWLTSLDASASGGAESSESSSNSSSGSSAGFGGIAGPSLDISGCARGQEGVAGFVTALKEIDGVTRVGVKSSAIAPEGSGAAEGGGGGGGGGSTDCRTRPFIAQFEMTVAFDAAPVPVSESAEEAVSAEVSESSTTSTSSTPEG